MGPILATGAVHNGWLLSVSVVAFRGNRIRGVLRHEADMSGWPARREPMEWLATEFAARIREGEHPTIAEYVQEYPEYAAQIRRLFPAVALMEQLRNQEGDSGQHSADP